jgi:SagB-type dehydrogenase family enzyme
LTGAEAPVRVRRAAALVVVFERGRPVVWNYLVKRSFACTPDAIEVLAAAEEWAEPRALQRSLPGADPASLARELTRLLDLGALLVEGTAAADRDEDYRQTWEWGVSAGLYHFSIRDEQFADDAQTAVALSARIRRGAPPSAVEAGDVGAEHALGGLSDHHDHLKLMWSRRSRRAFVPEAIGADQLARCLYSGLGITGTVEDALLGTLPLAMTPSGGARNPYEGYVYVRRVAGFDPGVYHYSGLRHALTRVAAPPLPPIGALLSGQQWADDAAAVVLLAARFERTMWKYGHPNSYRVVLIEAGHIAQNILLAATAEDLAAAPTRRLAGRAARSAARARRRPPGRRLRDRARRPRAGPAHSGVPAVSALLHTVLTRRRRWVDGSRPLPSHPSVRRTSDSPRRLRHRRDPPRHRPRRPPRPRTDRHPRPTRPPARRVPHALSGGGSCRSTPGR